MGSVAQPDPLGGVVEQRFLSRLQITEAKRENTPVLCRCGIVESFPRAWRGLDSALLLFMLQKNKFLAHFHNQWSCNATDIAVHTQVVSPIHYTGAQTQTTSTNKHTHTPERRRTETHVDTRLWSAYTDCSATTSALQKTPFLFSFFLFLTTAGCDCVNDGGIKQRWDHAAEISHCLFIVLFPPRAVGPSSRSPLRIPPGKPASFPERRGQQWWMMGKSLVSPAAGCHCAGCLASSRHRHGDGLMKPVTPAAPPHAYLCANGLE